MTSVPCTIVGLILALAAGPLWAGGASAAVTGANGVGASAANAGADDTGRLRRINQYSVKSYTVIRQVIATSGIKTDSGEAAAAR
jgi:hypothetical protein